MKRGHSVDELCVEGGITVHITSIAKYLNELHFSIYDIRPHHYDFYLHDT